MATNIVKAGFDMDPTTYANTGSAISSGDAVKVGTVSAFLGIALTDIAATTGIGALARGVVATVPKVSAAVFAKGDLVLWDVSSGTGAVDDNSATPATGDFWCGTAEEAGANGETTAQVLLHPTSSAVT